MSHDQERVQRAKSNYDGMQIEGGCHRMFPACFATLFFTQQKSKNCMADQIYEPSDSLYTRYSKLFYERCRKIFTQLISQQIANHQLCPTH